MTSRRRIGSVLVAVGVTMVVVGAAGLVFGLGDGGSSPTSGSRRAAAGDAGGGAGHGASVTTTTAPAETLSAFVAQFAAARRSGDTAFLAQRLHPAVIARYGTGQCSTAVAGLVDPTAQLTVVSTSTPASWDYTSDGRTTAVPDVVTARLQGTLFGAPVQQDFHLALVDGTYRVFYDCGDPR